MLLEQAKLDVETVQDSYAWHRPSLLGEAECGTVEGEALLETWYIDADRNGGGHRFLCRPTSSSPSSVSPITAF